jgi:hypothetical protein
MLPLLLLLVTTQVPCTPGETTLVCHCKQGMANACEALRQVDAKLADAIEKALMAAKLAEEVSRKAAELEDEASPSDPEPPDWKGQNHHVISRPIAKALEKHGTLRGQYQPRDPRFVAKAVDEEAHCGYQQWHRDVDAEVIAWLERYKNATVKQFEALLRQIYNRPAMRTRFPNGF